MANNDPNNDERNPGNTIWNDKVGSSGTPSALHDMETNSGSSTGNLKDTSTNDLGDKVRGGENTDGAWKDNVTGKSPSRGGLKGLGNKVKVFLRKKIATLLIFMLLGLGAIIPFGAAASLPFAIVGNMDARSMMHGLEQYSQDYNGFRLFGGSGNSTSVSSTANKIKGLTDSEITQLENNGVGLEGGKKNPITGKTTYTAVKYEGKSIHAGNEFKAAMRGNTAFRSAMVIDRGSYWKSAKSDFAAKVKNFFKVDTNPDLSGKTEAERNKQLFNESVEGSDTVHATAATEQANPNKPPDPAAAQGSADAASIANEVNDQVAAERAAIEGGSFTPAMAVDSNMGNIGAELSKNGVDIADATTAGLGGKIWGYVNALSPLNTVCTVYQAASTANILARTIALVNIVRFAITIRATIEKAKSGNDNGQAIQYLMDLIQRKDPTTGQSFDGTSYAAFLFSGQLSSEPSTVSAFGGQAMIALYLTMHSINSVFGQFASVATLGVSGSGATSGRQFLKSVCGVAQNVGVQVLATGFSVIAAIFTGGASGATGLSLKAGITKAFKTITDEMVSKFGKDAVKALIKKEGEKIGSDGLVKYMSRNAWSAFTTMWEHMGPWDKVGLLFAGVSTFGMGYIVDALSGGNIAGFINNGFSAFDAVGTGWNQYESVNGIASGGNMATYSQATAYQQTQQTYTNSYIADMQYQAKDTPLDIKTPYSALGSVMLSLQKTIGISASLSLPSTLASVAMLPFKLPTLFTAHADSTPTPAQIGNQVSNPYFQEKQITVTTTGSAQVIFQKHYSFQGILDKLVDSPTPQIAYGGNDPVSGSPLLTVISQQDPSATTMSLSNYIDKCHNPDKTEADPEFADDTDTNIYDVTTCIPGGKNYDSNVYPLYDDAVRFMGQVGPDATAASTSASASSSTSTSGSAGQAAGTSGRDDTPAKYKAMAQACIAQSGGACTSTSWLGMLPGQCSSFAAWRAAQQWYGPLLAADGSNLQQVLQSHPLPTFGSSLGVGNGVQVASQLIASGMASAVSGGYANVQPGDIVSVHTNNAAGHVFVILSVTGGVITVEDYNAAGGPGRYGTKKTTDWPLYSASNIVAIARVHKNGGVK